jgi:hypothetical protein
MQGGMTKTPPPPSAPLQMFKQLVGNKIPFLEIKPNKSRLPTPHPHPPQRFWKNSSSHLHPPGFSTVLEDKRIG